MLGSRADDTDYQWISRVNYSITNRYCKRADYGAGRSRVWNILK